jgi:hypothetical protein
MRSKICLLSDVAGIWFKANYFTLNLINRKLGVSGNKAKIFSKIFEKKRKLARIGNQLFC